MSVVPLTCLNGYHTIARVHIDPLQWVWLPGTFLHTSRHLECYLNAPAPPIPLTHFQCVLQYSAEVKEISPTARDLHMA